jgi:hypothetical protein
VQDHPLYIVISRRQQKKNPGLWNNPLNQMQVSRTSIVRLKAREEVKE